MKKIKNKYGVINTVTEDQFKYLMSLNEGYTEVKEKKAKETKEAK